MTIVNIMAFLLLSLAIIALGFYIGHFKKNIEDGASLILLGVLLIIFGTIIIGLINFVT